MKMFILGSVKHFNFLNGLSTGKKPHL